VTAQAARAPAAGAAVTARGPDGLVFEARIELGGFLLDAGFSVGPKERVALVGPSGAGKSTVLHLVAGLLRADRARITLAGQTLCDTARAVDLPPHARRVGLVFQDGALFPHLSVRDNVAYGARARGGRAAEVRATVERWLERLHLVELAARRPAQLSGGQRQRVGLARAIVSGARVLLLDEPFGSLDVLTRDAVRAELRAFLDEVGLPTLTVTHDAVDARVFGDRLVVLDHGRVVQEGRWEDLAAEPRGAFAAELAGLNLYRVALARGSGLREARVGGVALHVLAEGLAGEVYVAFAPGEVALSRERPAGSPQNVLRARVTTLLPMSDRVRIRLDAGIPITAEVTREALARLGLEPGVEAWASVKATAIRVYP